MAGGTPFAAMPSGSLNGWLLWCKSHDWGQGPQGTAWFDDTAGELVTYADESDDGVNWRTVEARHTTPRALKAWAGY